MRRIRNTWAASVAALALSATSVGAQAPAAAANAAIEPAAMAALSSMGTYLRTLKSFQVEAVTTDEDVLVDGQKIQYSGVTNILARMTVRFFGGWSFASDDARARDLAGAGYAKGVPMGADLPKAPAGTRAPSFLVAALQDPMGGNLDRIQIVKGWLDKDGKPQEKIYDVAWGDAASRKPGADGKLPPVGDTVDVAHATWEDSIGDPELRGFWRDPAFDPAQLAFYYVRAVEIPTPRWTAYDAMRFGIQMPPEVPMKHHERAWTSPIWYSLARKGTHGSGGDEAHALGLSG